MLLRSTLYVLNSDTALETVRLPWKPLPYMGGHVIWVEAGYLRVTITVDWSRPWGWRARRRLSVELSYWSAGPLLTGAWAVRRSCLRIPTPASVYMGAGLELRVRCSGWLHRKAHRQPAILMSRTSKQSQILLRRGGK